MRYLAMLGLGAALASAAAFAADMKTVSVNMTEAQEVPPHDGKGAGTASLTLDPGTMTVTWKITWSNLSSDAVAAHIHGPAAPGANAGVVVNLAPSGVKNPLEGSAKLSAAQWADLMAGKDYINVHTTTNKGGEIRGQITPGM